MRSQLQYTLPLRCSTVVFVGQGNCFFPVHERKEKEEEEDEEEIEEDKEITSAIQSFVAMQNSCTYGPRL